MLLVGDARWHRIETNRTAWVGRSTILEEQGAVSSG
jgi:hypothetical protein